MLRSRADAAFAIAEVIDRNELPVQLKQAIKTLSDGRGAILKGRRSRSLPGIDAHLSFKQTSF
jgi:hypothetical protein